MPRDILLNLCYSIAINYRVLFLYINSKLYIYINCHSPIFLFIQWVICHLSTPIMYPPFHQSIYSPTLSFLYPSIYWLVYLLIHPFLYSLSHNPSTHPWNHPHIHSSMYSTKHQSIFIYPPIHSYILPSTYSSIHIPIFSFTSIHPFIFAYTYPFIYTHPSIQLSVYPSSTHPFIFFFQSLLWESWFTTMILVVISFANTFFTILKYEILQNIFTSELCFHQKLWSSEWA